MNVEDKIKELKEQIWQLQLQVRKLEDERDKVKRSGMRFGIQGCENTKI